MLRWATIISHSTTIIAYWDFYSTKKSWHFEKNECHGISQLSQLPQKNCDNCESVWRLPGFFHNCHKFAMHNCEILTIVAMLSWNIATYVTARLFKCNWIDLWSMGVLRFFWMSTANHIAGLNQRSANGLTDPSFGSLIEKFIAIIRLFNE